MLVKRYYLIFISNYSGEYYSIFRRVAFKVLCSRIHELFFTLFALIVIAIKIIILAASIGEIIKGNITVGTTVALLSFTDKIYTPIAIFNVIYIDYKLDKITFIIIAHRINTIKNVDNIFLIDNGSIKEHGNFSKLMSKNGLFKKLWGTQKQNKF